MTPRESIQLVIQAFAVGIAVPLLVQLFLTLRTAQKTMLSIRARAERTLDGLEGVIARAGAPTAGSQALSALGAALVPALGAALRAWRAGMLGTEAASTAETDPRACPEDSQPPRPKREGE